MNGKAHLMMGGIFGIGASMLIEHTINLELIGISVLAATLPDFDTGSSARNKLSGNPKKTKRNLMIGGTLGIVYSMIHGHFISLGMLASSIIFLIGLLMSNTATKKVVLSTVAGVVIVTALYYHMIWLAGLGVYIAAAPHTGHRTWTHSIWAVVAMFIIFNGAEHAGLQGATIGGMAGFISHLVADAVTVEGVAFLYPIIPLHFGVKLMHSSQMVRQYCIVAAFGVAMFLLVSTTVGFDRIIHMELIG
jgi:inner membrane protein